MILKIRVPWNRGAGSSELDGKKLAYTTGGGQLDQAYITKKVGDSNPRCDGYFRDRRQLVVARAVIAPDLMRSHVVQ